MGTQRNTDWEMEKLYQIIDGRYGEENTTIITSNLSPDRMKNISSGRVLSRLKEMCVFLRVGLGDYRDKSLVVK